VKPVGAALAAGLLRRVLPPSPLLLVKAGDLGKARLLVEAGPTAGRRRNLGASAGEVGGNEGARHTLAWR
jgi:hypothetical protein